MDYSCDHNEFRKNTETSNARNAKLAEPKREREIYNLELERGTE